MQFHFLTNCIQPTFLLHLACSFSSWSSSSSSSSSLTSSSSSLWSSSPPQRRPLRRDQWMSEKEVPSFSVTVISFHSSTLFVFLLLIAVVVLFLFMCYIYNIFSLVFYDWQHWEIGSLTNADMVQCSEAPDVWHTVPVHCDVFWSVREGAHVYSASWYVLIGKPADKNLNGLGRSLSTLHSCTTLDYIGQHKALLWSTCSVHIVAMQCSVLCLLVLLLIQLLLQLLALLQLLQLHLLLLLLVGDVYFACWCYF